MGKKGNAVFIVVLVIAIGFVLFLSVPIGGRIGLVREAAISFIFRKPPRFISLEVKVDGNPQTVNAGESLLIKGTETIVITKVKANTFFDSYLTADVVGFGSGNDLHEPVDTAVIRNQLLAAGLRSVPIDVYYIEHNIAKVPLVMELTEQDFVNRVNESKNVDDKIAILKSAHASFPKNRQFVSMLDELLSQKDDYVTLAGIYKSITDSDPEDMNAYAQLSRCYIRLGMFKEAMDMSRVIVDKGRATSATYRRMGYISGQLGDFDGRVKHLEKALELDPGNDSIIIDLAKTYEQAGKNAKALEIYKTAAEKAKDREILIPVIEDALKRKKYDEAASLLKRYVTYYPQDKNAYAQLGMITGRLGDTEAQTKYYAKAVELSPKDPVLLFNLGAAFEKAGKEKNALDSYKKALAIKPDDKDCLLRAAALSQKSGDYLSSYNYYQSLLKVEKSNTYRKGLISAAVGLKDHTKIIDSAKDYLKHAKDHDAAITLAYAYEARAASKEGKQRLEDLNKALEAYKLALKINPNSKKAQEKIPELKIETIRLKKRI
jgi:tetratricopeptide (TPR) repeat protein